MILVIVIKKVAFALNVNRLDDIALACLFSHIVKRKMLQVIFYHWIN